MMHFIKYEGLPVVTNSNSGNIQCSSPLKRLLWKLVMLNFLLIVSVATAQSFDQNLQIPKLNGKIQFDGKIDEPAWLSIDPLPLTLHWPDFEGKPSEQTEMRVTYDDEYIYLGAICKEQDPSNIQTPTFQRDDWGSNMDQVVLGLDTYNDNENILTFAVTASGSRIDAATKNDAQSFTDLSTSWNSYWDAEVTQNDNGWEIEMRIPFSSLRFKQEGDKVTMGLIAYRFIARNRELSIFPAIPPNWGFLSIIKPSKAQTVTFDSPTIKRPWYVSPYALGGIGHHFTDDDNDIPEKFEDDDIEIGIDIQHALNDNINADFTFNTDFAQVEADDQVVNLSRFSLFFPEKRRFFLERASIFDFKNDLNNNMFYSRRIGIDDGEKVPIWGGIRLVGRMNDWDVGIMNMQSREINDIASENFGVVRVRKNVFNERSYMGAMMTSRIGADGHRNFAYGLDGIFNLFKDDYLQVNLAQTNDTDDDDGIEGIDKSRIYLLWERRIGNGFGYKVSYSRVGDDYNPGLGFERRKNYSQIGDQLSYSWFAPDDSPLLQTTIKLKGNVSFNNETSSLETSSVSLEGNWQWERGNTFDIEIERFRDVLPESFDLSDDITIEPAEYSNTTAKVTYGTPQVKFASVMTTLKAGTFYGGDLWSINIQPNLVFSKYFQLGAFYEYNNIQFDTLQTNFEAHVARLTLKASLNVKLSMSAFAQINSLEEISAVNFRLRYNPVDGNDFYLVYNEVVNNNPRSHIPILPKSEARAIMVKYIHTFKL